jgi:hypothetical protein
VQVGRWCPGRRVWLAASYVCAIGLVVGGTSLAAAAGPVSTPIVPTIPPSAGSELPTVPVPLPGLARGTTTPPTSSPGSGAGGSVDAGTRGGAGTQGGGSPKTSSTAGVSPGASAEGPSISAPSGRPLGVTRGAARSAPRRAKHRSSWPVVAAVLVGVALLTVGAFCTRRRWQDPLRRQWQKRVGHRRSGVRSVSPNPGAPRLVTGESKPGGGLGETAEQGAALDPADAAAVRDALAQLATRGQVRI